MITITTGDMMHVHGAFGAGVDYSVRTTVRLQDAVDPRILSEALELTQKRYPYLCVRLCRNGEAFYYEENPFPVALLNTASRITLGADMTNGHLWAVSYLEDRIFLDFFHGLADGTGQFRVLATLLYYYCKERYGVTDRTAVLTLDDPVTEDEYLDPQEGLVPDPGIVMSSLVPREGFTLETDGGLTPDEATLWDIEIPEEAFLRFTSAHDASPGTMVALLLARTIDSLYPEREKDITGAYVINARPMLDAPMTYHNCLGMAFLTFDDRVKRLEMTQQCTVFRGKTFVQSDADRIRESTAQSAENIRQTVKASATIEEKKQAFGKMFNGGEGIITYLVSYIGQWKQKAQSEYIREMWVDPPNSFSLMAEITAVNGKIFVTIQQRFKEDTIREGFVLQLEKENIPCLVRRKHKAENARVPEPR